MDSSLKTFTFGSLAALGVAAVALTAYRAGQCRSRVTTLVERVAIPYPILFPVPFFVEAHQTQEDEPRKPIGFLSELEDA